VLADVLVLVLYEYEYVSEHGYEYVNVFIK
jgi:hypothetical protein